MVNINVNIQKKDLFLIAAIVVFMAGAGIIIGYIPNPIGVSGSKAPIMGHSIDELNLAPLYIDKANDIVSIGSLSSGKINVSWKKTLGNYGEDNYPVFDFVNDQTCGMAGLPPIGGPDNCDADNDNGYICPIDAKKYCKDVVSYLHPCDPASSFCLNIASYYCRTVTCKLAYRLEPQYVDEILSP
jgi:hypothetical protein